MFFPPLGLQIRRRNLAGLPVQLPGIRHYHTADERKSSNGYAFLDETILLHLSQHSTCWRCQLQQLQQVCVNKMQRFPTLTYDRCCSQPCAPVLREPWAKQTTLTESVKLHCITLVLEFMEHSVQAHIGKERLIYYRGELSIVWGPRSFPDTGYIVLRDRDVRDGWSVRLRGRNELNEKTRGAPDRLKITVGLMVCYFLYCWRHIVIPG